MTIRDRLTQAIEAWRLPNGRRGSIRSLHRELSRRKVKGSSYSSVHGYVTGGPDQSEPPLEFLVASAEILGVRTEWLITGSGGRTEEDQEARLEREVRRRLEASASPDRITEYLSSHLPWDTPLERRLRTAALRFARILDDSTPADVSWARETDERVRLVSAAVEFLVLAEKGIEQSAHQAVLGQGAGERRYPIDSIALELQTEAERTQWENAILDAFSRRVYGLGLPAPKSFPRMRRVAPAEAAEKAMKRPARHSARNRKQKS